MLTGSEGCYCISFDTHKGTVTEIVGMDENGEGGTKQTSEKIIFEQVIVPTLGYANIVSAIVRERYDGDAVQAILANKALADDKDSNITDEKRREYKEDYAAFQAWRVKAKGVASEIVELTK